MKLNRRLHRLRMIAAIAAALGSSAATLSGSVTAFALAQSASDAIVA